MNILGDCIKTIRRMIIQPAHKFNGINDFPYNALIVFCTKKS